MPNTKGFETFFKDYAVPKASGEDTPAIPQQETLGNLATRKADSPCAGVTHSDATVEWKYDNLRYGTPDADRTR